MISDCNKVFIFGTVKKRSFFFSRKSFDVGILCKKDIFTLEKCQIVLSLKV